MTTTTTGWPTSSLWHCQQCDARGEVAHAPTAPVWQVLGLLASDHADVAPGCHAMNSLYRVRLRTADTHHSQGA